MQSRTIIQKVKKQLESRGGVKTIRSIGRMFRIMDSMDGNRKLDAQQFLYGLKDMGCNLTKDETMTLMKQLDKNRDGSVDFDQFLFALRGKLNPKRQAIVDKCYLKFDKDCNGKITIMDLKGTYNCSMHPKVQNGTLSEDQVFLQFLQNFGDQNKDGTITRAEWNDYYGSVSASVDNDDHFVQIMKMAWKLQ